MRIGGIYAEIRARVQKLRGDLNKAEGMVRGSAKNMQTSVSSIGFASAGIAATAFGAIVAATAASGIKSYAELERKILRTESIIKATGNAAQLSSKQLVDLANRLDLATLNDRDAILDAINAMQTFRAVSGDVFTRSIELSVDLAEVLGTDLRSQVVQLGKALEDPITGLTALRRVGVSFTEQQKEQIKTLVASGEALKAQGIILDTISKQVGGAAEGAAGGLAGKVDTLSFRWREFKESLASSEAVISSIGGALDGLAKTLEKLATMDLRNLNPIFAMGQKILAAGGYTGAPVGVLEALDFANRGGIDRLSGAQVPDDIYGNFGAATAAGAGAAGAGGGGPAGVGFMLSRDRYIEHLQQIKTYADDYANFEAEQQAMLWQQQADYENNRLALIEKSEADIVRLKERSAGSQQKIARGLGTALLGLLGANNEAIFVATQGFDAAMAIISGHAAAAKALAEVPYPANLAVAAQMKATGYMEAAAIAATAIGSLATRGASVTGGGYGPVSTTNYGSTYEPEPQDTKGTLTVNVYGDISDPDSFVDALVEKINDAADRDVFVNLARGVRAA
jgi:phenylpyruvate tautomerase PptA (4-oxalocrotonate tautomerase family)